MKIADEKNDQMRRAVGQRQQQQQQQQQHRLQKWIRDLKEHDARTSGDLVSAFTILLIIFSSSHHLAHVQRQSKPTMGTGTGTSTAAERPTASKSSRPDYQTLLSLSTSSPPQILFRVTDPTSISPLYWGGNASSSGFACPNLNLAFLDPEEYAHLHGPDSFSLPGVGVGPGPYVRHTVLDHIMGKEKQTALPTITSIQERPDTPEDEKTPWISTSTNLFWCIYEICRRLVFLGREAVYLTVISAPVPPTGAGTGFKGGGETPTAGGVGRMMMLEPARVLHIGHAQAKDMMLSVGMKENYDLAYKASRNSGERLIWGRVYGQDIQHQFEFTMDVSTLRLFDTLQENTKGTDTHTIKHTPLELPPQIYDGGDGRKPSASKWTDRLVWDPTVDAYDTASRRVVNRRRELAEARGGKEPEVSSSSSCDLRLYMG